MKNKFLLSNLLLVTFLFFSTSGLSQNQYDGEIAAFHKKDLVVPPPKNAVLFIGSSTFRKWTTMEKDFPTHAIINRGFGGSTFPDVIHFANEIILPYQPKQVLIYCGDNDLASSDSVTPLVVLRRFKELFAIIRTGLPDAQIAFVSIKPSPSRARLMPGIVKSNKLVKKFLRKKKNTKFINTYDAMLGSDGQPMPDIFIEDKLHMNAKGYAIWQKIIEPYLL
jgi:lysophospholipase L1-like esterase